MSKLKRKLLIKKLVYLLYNVIILLISYIFNRFFQMLLFILFFNTIQNCFGWRFHADTLFPNEPVNAVKWCKVITISIELIYLCFCNRIDISLYSNLFVILFIALANALLQFYCERVFNSKEKLRDIETLKLMCQEGHVSDLMTKRMIMRFVENKSYKEIANSECVDELSVKQSIRRCVRKLKL